MLCMYAGCGNWAQDGETDEFRMCEQHAGVRDWIMYGYNQGKRKQFNRLMGNGWGENKTRTRDLQEYITRLQQGRSA